MNVIVGCVVRDKDKILMVKEDHGSSEGKWGFPVGHLEENETLVEGAIRETFEESGYNVKITGVLPITETVNNKGKYVLIRFIADVVSYVERELDGIKETSWMSVNEILNLGAAELRCCKSNKKVIEYITNEEVYSLNLVRGNIFE